MSMRELERLKSIGAADHRLGVYQAAERLVGVPR